MKRVVLLVASIDWSSQFDESVWHQAVAVGSVVAEGWLEVGLVSLSLAELYHHELVRGRDGLWVLVLDSSMSLLLASLSASLRFSIIQHLPSASLATAYVLPSRSSVRAVVEPWASELQPSQFCSEPSDLIQTA